MAANEIQKPGTKFGPCKPSCQHRDCQQSRTTAAAICRFCGKAVGYETRYYADPEEPHVDVATDGMPKYVHAHCLEEAQESR